MIKKMSKRKQASLSRTEKRRQFQAQKRWMKALQGKLEWNWYLATGELFIDRVWRDETGSVYFAEQVFAFPRRKRK